MGRKEKKEGLKGKCKENKHTGAIGGHVGKEKIPKITERV